MAQADYRRAREQLTRTPNLWWLDVETSNTWQADVVANAASLTGMVDYFQGKGLEIGLYSTSYQWNKIAGATSAASHLAGLRSWLAGGSMRGAPTDCEKSPLTPYGLVVMVQYVGRLDNDFSCHAFTGASAKISPSSASVPGITLTATHGRWAARGVSYSYRNGDRRRDLEFLQPRRRSDIGANITVTITGTKIGYSATPRTSDAVSVLDGIPLRPVE
ncbi:MAG: hypothetical protein WDM88_09115 [Galbitalea sp.]